jgi:DNA adenine methylase
MQMIKSPFRYPGGKSKKAIVEWILHHAPTTIQEYREPFVGGGGVFFAMPDTIPRRWINDKHLGLMTVYEALRSRPVEFITACKRIAPAMDGEPLTPPGPRGGRPMNARLATIFEDMKQNPACDTALRYFFINRTVHGGRVNYDIPSRIYFSNPEGWNIVKTDRLEKCAIHLQNTKITCGDYEKLLMYPGEDVWIYMDPPYYVNSELHRCSQLYQHNFAAADHERFAAAVLCCPHKFALSYDDCDMVRSLFKGFNIVENKWTYCGAASNKKKATGNEVLILNYEP